MKQKLPAFITFLGLVIVASPAFAQPQVKIDSLETLLKITDDQPTRLKILNQIGYEYWTIDPVQSEKYGEQAIALATRLNDTTALAMANRVIGVSHWSRGNLIPALQHLFKSQELYKQMSDMLGEANSTMNIGLVYEDEKEFKKALAHFTAAKQLFEKLQNQERLGMVLGKIGSVYLMDENPQQAREYLSKAIKIQREIGFQFGIMETTNRLGLLSLDEGDLSKAESQFAESLTIARKNEVQEHIIKNLENLARVKILNKDLSTAEKFLNEAYPMAQSRSYKKWLRDIFNDYKQIYQAKKQFDKALLYSEKYENLKDSIFNEEKAAQLANLKMEKEAEEQRQALKLKEQEIAILEQKKRISQLSTISLISILIVVVLGSVLLFRAQQHRFRKKHDLVKRDLERARQIEEELKQTLHFKDKELTSYTMNFIRKNELIEELGEKVATLKSKLPEQSKELASILNLVQNNNIDKDWDDFKRIFENVHTDFFTRLLEKHSDLSPTELKLCALVQLNLSVKEMASLMGISPDSVKTSRYRLKKKLGLTQSESLPEYIMNYA